MLERMKARQKHPYLDYKINLSQYWEIIQIDLKLVDLVSFLLKIKI